MRISSPVLIGVAVVAGLGLFFLSRRPAQAATAPSATGGRPINSLPARRYAISPFSLGGQPPGPQSAWAPFAPIAERALTDNSGSSSLSAVPAVPTLTGAPSFSGLPSVPSVPSLASATSDTAADPSSADSFTGGLLGSSL